MSEEKEPTKGKTVSFTQFSIWSECPFRWYLNYVKKLRVRIESISTLFGRTMHEVLQYYLTTMYTQTISEADGIDLPKLLFDRMCENFLNAQGNHAEMAITKEDMVSFFEDGCLILDWFVKNKGEYFTKRGFELVGTEVPIEWPVQSGVTMFGFLDVVIRDTVLNRIKIYDFKTSRQGWNKYQKADKRKLSQLVFYKSFYAVQYGYDPKDVDVEFLILKRKLYENVAFPQKRVQKVAPASGTISTNNLLLELKTFVNTCFDTEGNYRTDIVYEKRPSVKACKYCDFKDKPDICDKNNPKRAARLIAEMEKKNDTI